MTWDAFWLAVVAAIISAATLWNGARRTTLDSMKSRIEVLEREKKELAVKVDDLEREVRELQRNNRRLQREIDNLSDGDKP